MTELQRITVEYMDYEDRFRLTGEMLVAPVELEDLEVDENSDESADKNPQESADVETVTIWLTQRLMNMLLPVLFEWLQQRSPEVIKNPTQDRQASELLQGFAQHAATEQIPQQTPVQSQGDSLSWLVREVDIGRGPEGVKLTLKGHNGEEASISLVRDQLRQWLSILHAGWIRAEWPVAIWPSWMQENTPIDASPSTKAFH